MEIEISYRGKRVDNGEWAEGSYYYASMSKRHFIVREKWAGNAEFIRVIPETVGQLRYQNRYGSYFDGDVYYHAGYGLETVSDLCELQDALMHGNSDDICDIKGNIHDNPELIQ